MKIKLKNEFGAPINLLTCTKLTAIFKYEDGRYFEKQIHTFSDAENGIADVELSDFEIQGLPIGLNQTFYAKAETYHEEELYFEFTRCFGVEQCGERKAFV